MCGLVHCMRLQPARPGQRCQPKRTGERVAVQVNALVGHDAARPAASLVTRTVSYFLVRKGVTFTLLALTMPWRTGASRISGEPNEGSLHCLRSQDAAVSGGARASARFLP